MLVADKSALETQAIFKEAMMAIARPGQLRQIPIVAAPAELPTGLAALALALCDFETPVWLDSHLASSPAVTDWLRFHTGAPITPNPSDAVFAFAISSDLVPELSDFAQGTDENPDRSTTLVMGVDNLSNGPGWTLAGPGVNGVEQLKTSPLRSGFMAERAVLSKQFPRGMDVFFVAGTTLAALPRSTQIVEGD